jgi:hypothetical protein
MIPANAAQTAITMAEQFESLGRRVIASPETPLAALASLSALALKPSLYEADGSVVMAADMAASMNAEYLPTAKDIEAESRLESVEDPNLSQHDVQMDAIITDLANSVGQHLTFAKNTVRPMIATFVEMTSQALAAYPDTATYNPKVNKVDLPQVAFVATFESEVQKFKDVVYQPMSTALNLPIKQPDEVIALMTTGSDAVDKAIAAWVDTSGKDFFLTVYNVVFCATAPDISSTPDAFFSNKEKGQEVLVAAFLMARNLLDAVPEGVMMNLSEYRIAVGTVVEQTARRLCTAYEDRQRYSQLDTLILSYDDKNVWVFGPVYDKWLADGGLQAVLFGNLLLDRPNLSLPAMLEDQQKCMERWERENLFLTTTVRNRRHDAAKATLSFWTEKMLAENLQTIFGEVCPNEELTLNSNQPRSALESALVYISCLDHDTIKDLWNVGIEVVAGCFFNYSSASDILRGIESAVKDNPNIDPNEAALLATIEYVSVYVVNQMELVDL